MARARSSPVLPSPGVRFGPDFLRRVGIFTLRMTSARERREGAGRAQLQGVGSEFVGYRPYRPGEDLRQLDWNLYARLRKPFVRVARREASERWCVLLDTSGSMGVGTPGKLQCAAEVATALAALGLRQGAVVELRTSSGERGLLLKKPGDLAPWMRLLEGCRARGEGGLARLAREPGRLRAAGRVFCLGDLLDVEPQELFALARRGRELCCAQILAPEELAPATTGAIEWVDAESGQRRLLDVDHASRARYEDLLSARLESWGAACVRHRVAYGCWSSARSFEEIAAGLLGA